MSNSKSDTLIINFLYIQIHYLKQDIYLGYVVADVRCKKILTKLESGGAEEKIIIPKSCILDDEDI